MTPTDRLIFAFITWGTCMAFDYGLHQIGVHRGRWNWKKALVSFGIGTILVTWLFGPK